MPRDEIREGRPKQERDCAHTHIRRGESEQWEVENVGGRGSEMGGADAACGSGEGSIVITVGNRRCPTAFVPLQLVPVIRYGRGGQERRPSSLKIADVMDARRPRVSPSWVILAPAARHRASSNRCIPLHRHPPPPSLTRTEVESKPATRHSSLERRLESRGADIVDCRRGGDPRRSEGGRRGPGGEAMSRWRRRAYNEAHRRKKGGASDVGVEQRSGVYPGKR
ncbi:hypothetical protein DFH07DRAFT_772064 [Mycena maculata]|uniref:Uncharacterized protein n=1 Tax=Mycena maculata TaxID=230809 RepID=A0AAD7JCK1_9AGAR|nr:hypothetical protein DFH07DRAFT_772064 [Mycena maculata]